MNNDIYNLDKERIMNKPNYIFLINMKKFVSLVVRGKSHEGFSFTLYKIDVEDIEWKFRPTTSFLLYERAADCK